MLYLDDDSVGKLLVRLLVRAGYDVQTPADVGKSGQKDPIHMMQAIGSRRVLLTHNYDDFKLLHELILFVNGHHPGILVVRLDNDPKRDLNAPGIVRAIRKLLAASLPLKDELHILNHWR